jgi:hypothetical protein
MVQPANVIAGVFGLSAFLVAIIAGLAAGNPASDILAPALVSMIVLYLVGIWVGASVERIAAAYIEGMSTPKKSTIGSVENPVQTADSSPSTGQKTPE